MCGIAGILAPKGFSPSWLADMSQAMLHRGPDGFGYMLCSPNSPLEIFANRDIDKVRKEPAIVGFAHRRLSIIDLSEENTQPLADASGRVAVTYNGEIYNYLELKSELKELGYSFSTSGDTEVLLAAYLEWGIDCVKKFNGQWAFALWDRQKQCVHLCRDRFGIKPLFYTRGADGALFFASEIKALWAVKSLNLKPNEAVVSRFLSEGLTDDIDQTFFEGVYRLPAASYATLYPAKGLLELTPQIYWDYPQNQYEGSLSDAVEQFKELFFDAVRIHARSDVPVGSCLSGGMDSSSIVCVSEQLRRQKQIPSYSHMTFGYTPKEEQFSEKPYMQAVVDATSAKMHYILLSPDELAAHLPEIIYAQDEPFASASIAAQWAVFRRARAEGITVMLDGQGADEMMAGYHSYFAVLASLFVDKRRFGKLLKMHINYRRHIGPFPYPLKSMLLAASPAIVRRAWYFVRSKKAARALGKGPEPFINPAMLEKAKSAGQVNSSKINSLNDILREHMSRTSLPALLRYEDRNSMAHSLESRVPFLDYRLVDFVFSLPDDFKINGVSTKHILRLAMKDILPQKVMDRKDKMGFRPAPILTLDLAQAQKKSLLEDKTP
ncbi:MAG: asparagine synthase (glutamine-hydrolyzing), partial [Desulfatibacillaceae bacterium]|nr:asparagine synthase (glutamine-hydrolyzing) [Desulfatibacillaceae bacterium]